MRTVREGHVLEFKYSGRFLSSLRFERQAQLEEAPLGGASLHAAREMSRCEFAQRRKLCLALRVAYRAARCKAAARHPGQGAKPGHVLGYRRKRAPLSFERRVGVLEAARVRVK